MALGLQKKELLDSSPVHLSGLSLVLVTLSQE